MAPLRQPSITTVVAAAAIATLLCFQFAFVYVHNHELYAHQSNNSNSSNNNTVPSSDGTTPTGPIMMTPTTIAATIAATTTTTPTTINETNWQMILSTDPPFSNMTPKLDVIWGKGWYTTQLFPPWIPMDYYHSPKHPRLWKSKQWDPSKVFQPTLHNYSHRAVWVRREAELESYFLNTFWPASTTTNTNTTATATAAAAASFVNLTLVTTDGDGDVPNPRLLTILNDPRLAHWYSENMIWYGHPKLRALPIGLDLHYDYTSSGRRKRTPVEALETMQRIRDESTNRRRNHHHHHRSNLILYDPGTGPNDDPNQARRNTHRRELANAIGTAAGSTNTNTSNNNNNNNDHCPANQFYTMNKTDQLSAWTIYSSHAFGIAPAGIGWDTHRLWEYLFFGTIPIVKSSPLDVLLVEAHVPVVILEDWSELCTTFNATETLDLYTRGWIQRADEWFKPSLWLPRDQERMDALCDEACWQVYEGRKHLLQKWKAPAGM